MTMNTKGICQLKLSDLARITKDHLKQTGINDFTRAAPASSRHSLNSKVLQRYDVCISSYRSQLYSTIRSQLSSHTLQAMPFGNCRFSPIPSPWMYAWLGST